jgi:small subunit ribosomal protein S16
VLKIKLSRTGRKNQPYYRIVVAEARTKNSLKAVATLGSYNPSDPKNKLTIDSKAYAQWLAKGAQPTETIRRLIIKQK